MSDSSMGGRSAPPASRRTADGRRASVHALGGSEAAARVDQTLREAERAIAALEDLLEPPDARRVSRLGLYLVNPGAPLPPEVAIPTDAPESSGLGAPAPDTLAALRTEGGGSELNRDITRLLVMRWFGRQAT